ncbi:hypothetical protein [Flavobacterium alkalisoli]|uniref:hypothetical protein n=1 Tax=Flavobacterium alkalisoli TaxID=2602769 RepID=UPI003A8EC450
MNKEFGSDFHYSYKEITIDEKSFFDSISFVFSFSGRSGLHGILKEGISRYGWKRIYFPSYYCHSVVDFVATLPVEIVLYSCNPFEFFDRIDFIDSSQSVIINVDFFGLKKLNLSSIKEAIIIEDLTHNIESVLNSTAHYCFGSLRKELPVPVGGFCYSPKNLELPSFQSNFESDILASEKFAAMILKREYLYGGISDKDIYRGLFEKSEDDFNKLYTNSAMPEWVKSLLFSLDVKKINTLKQVNIDFALRELKVINQLKVNFNNTGKAFGLVLECETVLVKNQLKDYLVENKIYPAILWPNQQNDNDILLAGKMLFLHMDYRYSLSDIKTIIFKLQNFFNHE